MPGIVVMAWLNLDVFTSEIFGLDPIPEEHPLLHCADNPTSLCSTAQTHVYGQAEYCVPAVPYHCWLTVSGVRAATSSTAQRHFQHGMHTFTPGNKTTAMYDNLRLSAGMKVPMESVICMAMHKLLRT